MPVIERAKRSVRPDRCPEVLQSLQSRVGEVLSLLDNETGMHSCLEPKTQASPVGAGGKRRHPRAHENTGIGADEPEA